MHGEQNGAIYQQVTLGRSDIAPVSLLVEDRADALECRIYGKHGDHDSHLRPRHTARDAIPGQGLWSSGGAHLLASLAERLPQRAVSQLAASKQASLR